MHGVTSLAIISLVTLLLAVSVSAGLYGTTPVASTVWNAGRSQTVTWTDDKSVPHLGQLGLMDIELLNGDDTTVATLAQGVDPKSKSETVWISPAWGQNGSDYYIRFYCKDRALSIYTSMFTLTDMSSVVPAGQTVQSSTLTDGLYTPYLTVVLPNATSVSALTPQRTTARPSPSIAPVTPDEEDAYLHPHGPSSNTAAGFSLGGRIDLERLKFRIVFVLWPAIVGITMAL